MLVASNQQAQTHTYSIYNAIKQKSRDALKWKFLTEAETEDDEKLSPNT